MSENFIQSLRRLSNNNNTDLDFWLVGHLHGGGFKIEVLNCFHLSDNLLNLWKQTAKQHSYYIKLKMKEGKIILICRETPFSNTAMYISFVFITILLLKILYYRNM